MIDTVQRTSCEHGHFVNDDDVPTDLSGELGELHLTSRPGRPAYTPTDSERLYIDRSNSMIRAPPPPTSPLLPKRGDQVGPRVLTPGRPYTGHYHLHGVQHPPRRLPAGIGAKEPHSPHYTLPTQKSRGVRLERLPVERLGEHVRSVLVGVNIFTAILPSATYSCNLR